MTLAPTLTTSSTKTGAGFSYKEWADGVLTTLRAPVSPANETFLIGWARTAENTSAAFNPLATTYPEPGATNFNSVGVKNYRTPAQGIDATSRTLLGGYPTIVKALRANYPVAIVSTPAGWADLNKWVSGNASPTHTQYVQNVQQGFYGKNPGVQDLIPGPSSASQAASEVAKATGLSGLTAFLGKLSDPNFWIRVLEIVGGAGLVALGLFLVAKDLGVSLAMPAPVRTAAEKVG